jgi:hypothetical protein
MGASLIGATKLKLSEVVNWKRLALQEQEELHNLQRHEQSLLAISQKPSVRTPNFTTYTTHPFLQWRLPSEQCKEPELSNSFAQPQKKPMTLEPTCHCENLQQSLDSQISDCFHRVRKTRLTIEQRMLLMNQEQAGEEKLRSRTSSDIQPNSHRSF